MARYAPNGFYTNGFSWLENGDTSTRRIVVTTAETQTYASVAAATLAAAALTDAQLAEAAGDVSGRKLTVSQFTDISITASGTATHVQIVDDTNSQVLYITTCTSQALTSGGTVTVPAWDIEVRAPAAP